MNTLRQLRILPIWVNPDHLVSTASHIINGHRVRALGVLDGTHLVGTISREEIAKTQESDIVGHVMRPIDEVVDADETIRAVAQRFAINNREFMPVVHGDTFLGIVTPNMLLRELGRSYDPLTGLSWSDHLREWGIERLKSGEEVTILFIDLNDFGQYNKRHGHIVGDKVIRRVSEYLQESIDPEREVLVRYGGDEFAIGTKRLRDEAELLADVIRRRVGGLIVEQGVEPVTFSVGIFGGRRSRERESTHFAATLDNLINIASRNCLAAKNAMKLSGNRSVVEPISPLPSERNDRFRVVGVYADEATSNGAVTVILSHEDSMISGAETDRSKPALVAAVNATAKAIERSRPDVGLRLENVHIEEGRVIVEGRLMRGNQTMPVRVSRQVDGDPMIAAAEATIDALMTSTS